MDFRQYFKIRTTKQNGRGVGEEAIFVQKFDSLLSIEIEWWNSNVSFSLFFIHEFVNLYITLEVLPSDFIKERICANIKLICFFLKLLFEA